MVAEVRCDMHTHVQIDNSSLDRVKIKPKVLLMWIAPESDLMHIGVIVMEQCSIHTPGQVPGKSKGHANYALATCTVFASQPIGFGSSCCKDVRT